MRKLLVFLVAVVVSITMLASTARAATIFNQGSPWACVPFEIDGTNHFICAGMLNSTQNASDFSVQQVGPNYNIDLSAAKIRVTNITRMGGVVEPWIFVDIPSPFSTAGLLALEFIIIDDISDVESPPCTFFLSERETNTEVKQTSPGNYKIIIDLPGAAGNPPVVGVFPEEVGAEMLDVAYENLDPTLTGTALQNARAEVRQSPKDIIEGMTVLFWADFGSSYHVEPIPVVIGTMGSPMTISFDFDPTKDFLFKFEYRYAVYRLGRSIEYPFCALKFDPANIKPSYCFQLGDPVQLGDGPTIYMGDIHQIGESDADLESSTGVEKQRAFVSPFGGGWCSLMAGTRVTLSTIGLTITTLIAGMALMLLIRITRSTSKV
ncbi:MAG: hypothetical protein KAT58_12285 [candidate division Zixibacteria bacterium]|nr:hypothetical protein [candidate division Zixibacteria bacterium]